MPPQPVPIAIGICAIPIGIGPAFDSVTPIRIGTTDFVGTLLKDTAYGGTGLNPIARIEQWFHDPNGMGKSIRWRIKL